MQVPPGNFPHAVGSFQNPVRPPVVAPDNPTDQICVQFSRAWLPVVLGALSQLLLQSTWLGDDSIIENAQINAMLLRYLFSLADTCPPVCPIGGGGFELLIRQDPDNDCFIQSSPDGTHWQTFIDLSLCNPGTAQPGAGAPQPPAGGGTATYCAQLNANDSLLLPTVVSTGDIITITKVSGAAWDGIEINSSGALWRCYDGTQFVAGSCVPGTTRLVSTDPLPTTPHMAIIAEIGGVRYPFVGNQIVVPGGVSNASVMLLVNDPPGTGERGSFQVCTQVTNNQPKRGTHTFDFTISDYGWTIAGDGDPGSTASWIPGVGFRAATYAGCGGVVAGLTATAPMVAASTITAITAQGTNDTTGTGGFHNPRINGSSGNLYDQTATGGAFNVSIAPNTLESSLDFVVTFGCELGSPTALPTLSKVIVSWQGTDPFPGAP